MAAESLIVTKSNGTTDYTFYKMSQSGAAVRFAYSGNSEVLRLFIDIDMTLSPIGSKKSDVRNVTLRREEVNATTGIVTTSKVSLQITIPKSTDIVADDINQDITQLMCLLTAGFTTSLIAGIVATGDYHVDGAFIPARV